MAASSCTEFMEFIQMATVTCYNRTRLLPQLDIMSSMLLPTLLLIELALPVVGLGLLLRAYPSLLIIGLALLVVVLRDVVLNPTSLLMGIALMVVVLGLLVRTPPIVPSHKVFTFHGPPSTWKFHELLSPCCPNLLYHRCCSRSRTSGSSRDPSTAPERRKGSPAWA